MPQDVEIKQVDTTYRHHAKTVTSHGVFGLNTSRLKWYDIARQDQPIDTALRESARNFLAKQAALPENELGFTLLHRCGESFYFLMLCTWRGNNELWKTVYYLDAEKMDDFALFPQDDPHKPTFCVWEMAVVSHEVHAWTQYLKSPHDQADEAAYLRSRTPID